MPEKKSDSVKAVPSVLLLCRIWKKTYSLLFFVIKIFDTFANRERNKKLEGVGYCSTNGNQEGRFSANELVLANGSTAMAIAYLVLAVCVIAR